MALLIEHPMSLYRSGSVCFDGEIQTEQIAPNLGLPLLRGSMGFGNTPRNVALASPSTLHAISRNNK